VASTVVARTPVAVLSLALVLFVRERTGSYAAAGAVAAAYVIASGLCAPLLGRLVDRIGQTRVLLPLTLVHVAALLGVVALGLADVPAVAVGLLAGVAGAAQPPLGACMRALWPSLLRDPTLLSTAYAIDAVLIEVVFVTGPLLAALAIAVWSPAAALVGGALLTLVGGLWFVALEPSRRWRPHGEHPGMLGALASPGMRTVIVCTAPIGICFGALEVAFPAFGVEHGHPSLAGVLLALQGVGSAAGGLWYGAAAQRLGGLGRAYIVLLALVPACFALVALPRSVLLMAIAVLVTGTVIAPLTIAGSQLAAHLAPAAAGTEAFTWIITALGVGIGAGSALAGLIVDAAGWRAAVLAACGIGLAGALVAFARRRTLEPVPAGG
jgi:predicted MFS family arabinose efflux permease